MRFVPQQVAWTQRSGVRGVGSHERPAFRCAPAGRLQNMLMLGHGGAGRPRALAAPGPPATHAFEGDPPWRNTR